MSKNFCNTIYFKIKRKYTRFRLPTSPVSKRVRQIGRVIVAYKPVNLHRSRDRAEASRCSRRKIF